MVYKAQDLLSKLEHLTLSGKDNRNGELEWIGTSYEWDVAEGNINEDLDFTNARLEDYGL